MTDMGRRQRSKRDGRTVGVRRAAGAAGPAGAGTGDPVLDDVREALGVVRHLRGELVELEHELRSAVLDARRRRASWRELGEALGTSAQGAQQRFGYRGGRGHVAAQGSSAGEAD